MASAPPGGLYTVLHHTERKIIFVFFQKQASQIKKYRVSILLQEAAAIIYMFSNSIVDHEYLYANNICILNDEKSSDCLLILK